MSIRTSCRDCCFAEYVENTQMACKLGKLEAFSKAGAEIVEAYDDDKEFCLIEGRVCPTCRQEDWAKKHIGEDLAALVRQEVAVRLCVVIYVGNANYDAIYKTIDSVLNQDLAASEIKIVVNQDDILASNIITYLRNINWELPLWNVFVSVERDEEGRRKTCLYCIDRALEGTKSSFYAVVPAGETLPQTFIRDIDVALNDKLERFVYLYGDKVSVVQTATHSYFKGNRPVEADDGEGNKTLCGNLLDKLHFAIKVSRHEEMIKPLGDICRLS